MEVAMPQFLVGLVFDPEIRVVAFGFGPSTFGRLWIILSSSVVAYTYPLSVQ